MRRMFAVAVAGLTVAGLVGIVGPAQATFPGTNGRIVFDTAFSHQPQIFTIQSKRQLCRALALRSATAGNDRAARRGR